MPRFDFRRVGFLSEIKSLSPFISPFTSGELSLFCRQETPEAILMLLLWFSIHPSKEEKRFLSARWVLEPISAQIIFNILWRQEEVIWALAPFSSLSTLSFFSALDSFCHIPLLSIYTPKLFSANCFSINLTLQSLATIFNLSFYFLIVPVSLSVSLSLFSISISPHSHTRHLSFFSLSQSLTSPFSSTFSSSPSQQDSLFLFHSVYLSYHYHSNVSFFFFFKVFKLLWRWLLTQRLRSQLFFNKSFFWRVKFYRNPDSSPDRPSSWNQWEKKRFIKTVCKFEKRNTIR